MAVTFKVRENPILILNTTWMKNYVGEEPDFFPGGFDFPKKSGFGYEAYNFEPQGRFYCGYASVVSETIRIEKLGAKKSDDYVDGVDVVWTAPSPDSDGRYVIGWYQSARIYRKPQVPSSNNAPRIKGQKVGFLARALVKDSVLLQVDERTLRVRSPGRAKAGEPGQSAAYFVPRGGTLEQKLRVLIGGQSNPGRKSSTKKSGRTGKLRRTRRPDAEHNKLVEQAAMDVVWNSFDVSWVLDNVSKDNKGWDIEARKGDKLLCIEVKGISGVIHQAELTPNEYKHALLATEGKFLAGAYRLALVTDALGKNPQILQVEYSKGARAWIDKKMTKGVEILPVTGGRIRPISSK